MRASDVPSFDIALATREVAGVLGDVAARDGLHLQPRAITHAAYARARAGLRAVEAFLRRLLMIIALQFEHDITVDVSPRPHPARHYPRALKAPGFRFRSFGADDALADLLTAGAETPWAKAGQARTSASAMVQAASVLERIAALRAIINTAEARGRRLAFVLARRRHGLLIAPLPHHVPPRMGTAFSAIYRASGFDIMRRTQARPPPQRPRPPPRPRIRQL